MNKNAIKKFAIDARNKLIASVTDKAGMLGITASGISDAITKGRDFEVYKTSAGTEVTLNRTQCEQRRRLVAQIEARGFEAVIEEVAYTWFNRICAIRFMEVNDYISVRVLSSIKDGKSEPDIVTNAPDVDIEFTDAEKSYILEAKIANKLDELFRMLFIKQCHELNDILPELFEKTEDYTEMLLNISFTNEDDVIRMLVDTVDEKDFNVTTLGEDGKPTGQVEIIGWLYQYYNTELKDDTFAKLKKNVKITKERIPAATQLFTPDWIVRYMVENSVGRIWIEHLRAVDSSVDEKTIAENFGWKYYLPEAEQEESVNVKLAEIRTSYVDLKPEDITCIDPCMGSGHILIAMFDVLMDVYKSTGYSEKEAAFSIVENNIHGLDIDKRAYQLAYFAVMMKGRGYNRRFFRGHDDKKPQPKVYAIQESNGINRAHIKYFGASLSDIEKNNALNQIDGLLHVMTDAREYGSLLNIDNYDWNLLGRFVKKSGEDNQLSLETIGIDDTKNRLIELLNIANIIARKYKAVVTNPPYMGNGGMSSKLSDFVKKEYNNGRNDLFAVFIDKCAYFTAKDGYQAMITQHQWMFLSSYEKVRLNTLQFMLINMAHLGPRAFEEISGEVVQSVAFVYRKHKLDDYNSVFSRLVEYSSQKEKEDAFLEQKKEDIIVTKCNILEKLPGEALAYWVSDNMINLFGMTPADDVITLREGIHTGKNEDFLRCWTEVDYNKLVVNATDYEDLDRRGRWVPYNKGGAYRKWYGNNDLVIGFDETYRNRMAKLSGHVRPSQSLYFKPGATWSALASGKFGLRFYPEGYLFDSKGQVAVGEKYLEIMGLFNLRPYQKMADMLMPTLDYKCGDVKKLPYCPVNSTRFIELVNECISIAKDEWDSYEGSWEFKIHPIVKMRTEFPKVEDAFREWKAISDTRFNAMCEAEKELNDIFASTYNLPESDMDVFDENDITLRHADIKTDIRSLISYAIGCLFGRYSLKKEGVICAGHELNLDDYDLFMPDLDGIIPITDEPYLDDDIVVQFVNWVKVVFGDEQLEENIEFIANAIGTKGNSSRQKLRNYFINEFYKDHCNMYNIKGQGQRPIYWLFDAGASNGFKCLIYMHRYREDMVGEIRTEYLHKVQNAIEQAKNTAERIRDNSNSGSDKSNAAKLIEKYTKQLLEIKLYDEAIAHMANKRLIIDLDDGVRANYFKFQDVEIAQEGKKALMIDLLAPIK